MGYERYPRDSNLGDYYNDQTPMDYGRDYGSGRDYSYSSARQYQAAGEFGGGRERSRDDGPREYGHSGYAEREQRGLNRGGGRRYVRDSGFQGSYGSDGHRFTDSGDRDYGRADMYRDRGRARDDRGRPQGYDYQHRDFFSRAGDEVRSWFGDDEAERRREMDARYDERQGGSGRYGRDDDYHSWRRSQIEALDRDYDEYRAENRTKFENEFGSWRTERQTQRSSLSKVSQHMEVVGSDGEHVGTVDKVQGDRILLTKNDADAGGRHHSIPSRWIQSVDDKVTIRKTAEDARAHWRDEERGAFFGSDAGRGADKGDATGPHMLNRSFSGTY
ncbi:hypothetical protein GCM10009087_23500 [Sphingomonas oligophenolica]|uniref:DUF2171 domain-containing protein n=1 Tax=Sphingomonas oligophenolica TaxID=301154 RepID=A0ABU9Y1J4_9SPHN